MMRGDGWNACDDEERRLVAHKHLVKAMRHYINRNRCGMTIAKEVMDAALDYVLTYPNDTHVKNYAKG